MRTVLSLVLLLVASSAGMAGAEAVPSATQSTSAVPPTPAQLALVQNLREGGARLREKYGIGRPWDNMADAPALVRRHRGLVAHALSLVSDEKAPLTPERQRALIEAASAVADLENGIDTYGQQKDRYLAHYYSTADGSGQPFVVRVPTDYDPAKPTPLIVILHGLGGRPKPADLGRPMRGYITAIPWGRGDLRWVGLAERDVLDVIEHVKTWYNVDDDRVYVDGGSMGGRGTWVMTSRHPDIFAAGAPLFGWADGLPLENLRNVPIFVMHGGSDWVVCVDHSRYAVSRLLQLGYNVAHKEFPAAGHFIPQGEDFTGDWMLTLRQPTAPEAITYTCQCEDQGKAYWLSIRRFTDPHQPATVKARMLGRGPYQMVTILPENIDVLELNVAKMGVDRGQRLLVQVGQTHLERKGPLPERLFLVKGKDGLSLLDSWTSPMSDIRPYQPGAAGNLYAGEPLLIVYGTKDPGRAEMLRRSAEKLSAFGGYPIGRNGESEMAVGRIPLKADTVLTDDDMQRYNLILIGLSRDNTVAARLMDKLPIRISDKNELTAGDRPPMSLEDAGLRLFHYNPLAPKRLIFLLGTNDDGEEAERWYAQPDRLMTGAEGDRRNPQADLVVQTFDQALRRRMQFTHDWKWTDASGGNRPAPAELAQRRAFLSAVAEVYRRAGEADYGLEAGASEARSMYDPACFTVADLMTEYAGPQQVLVADLTGQELVDIHSRWLSSGELTVSPTFDPKSLDAARTYRVAISPALCWTLKNRQKNLTNVRAGPDWVPQDLWQSILK